VVQDRAEGRAGSPADPLLPGVAGIGGGDPGPSFASWLLVEPAAAVVLQEAWRGVSQESGVRPRQKRVIAVGS
jgi:hypothetical protein